MFPPSTIAISPVGVQLYAGSDVGMCRRVMIPPAGAVKVCQRGAKGRKKPRNEKKEQSIESTVGTFLFFFSHFSNRSFLFFPVQPCSRPARMCSLACFFCFRVCPVCSPSSNEVSARAHARIASAREKVARGLKLPFLSPPLSRFLFPFRHTSPSSSPPPPHHERRDRQARSPKVRDPAEAWERGTYSQL